MQPMHASRNKRGRKLENKNKISVVCKRPGRADIRARLILKETADFKQFNGLAYFENESHSSLCLRHLSLPITLCQPAVTLPTQFLYVIYHLCSSFAPDHEFQMEYYDWNRFLVWKH